MAYPTVILGIDPGLDRTGYGAIEWERVGQYRLREGGVIRTSSADPLAARVGQIYEQIVELLDEFKPAALAIEQLYAHYKHPRTAILMGHARGAVLLAAWQRDVRVIHLAATTIKKHITGAGHASKQQMQRAVAAAFRLAKPPEPPDVADALAVALCAAERMSSPLRGRI
jgi:crossover junction endodeoxyribonuclease RuvC